jgi:hypothetical protein
MRSPARSRSRRTPSEVVMIETYAFLVAFAIQIFAGSVLNPARLIRYFRQWRERYASDLFEQRFPAAVYSSESERFITWYRAANALFVVVGVGVFLWLASDLARPDLLDTAKNVAMFFFFVQVSPLLLLTVYAAFNYRKLKPAPVDGKRKATLQRRGLFDYVSPLVLVFAIASYFLSVAFSLGVDYFVWHNATPSKNCLISIAAVTAVHLLNAVVIYVYLYGRKNPLVNPEGRAHSIASTVKACVYGSISVAWFMMLIGTLSSAQLKSWEPFALSAFFTFTMLLSFLGFTPTSRESRRERFA